MTRATATALHAVRRGCRIGGFAAFPLDSQAATTGILVVLRIVLIFSAVAIWESVWHCNISERRRRFSGSGWRNRRPSHTSAVFSNGIFKPDFHRVQRDWLGARSPSRTVRGRPAREGGRRRRARTARSPDCGMRRKGWGHSHTARSRRHPNRRGRCVRGAGGQPRRYRWPDGPQVWKPAIQQTWKSAVRGPRRSRRLGASAHCPCSAGFQTCCIADFQIGRGRCVRGVCGKSRRYRWPDGQRVGKPAIQQTWKSAVRGGRVRCRWAGLIGIAEGEGMWFSLPGSPVLWLGLMTGSFDHLSYEHHLPRGFT